MWGLGQLYTGGLSDRIGRKWLIAGGMLTQAAAIGLIAATTGFAPWASAPCVLGAGTAMVYPTLLAAIGDVAHPDLAGPRRRRLPALARRRLRRRRASSPASSPTAFGITRRDLGRRRPHRRLRTRRRRPYVRDAPTMNPNIDIVIDCTAPEHLAEFWAAALGYDKIGWFDPYYLLVSPVAGLPPVILQQVPEPKTTKTRVHFDIRTDDIEDEARRLERLGATRVDVGQTGGEAWIPMADPEGNEFCVCPGIPLPAANTPGPECAIDELLADARARLHRITADTVETEQGNGALIVDIRPADQRVRDGELPGAIVIDRNVLEWRLDPQSDHRIPQITGYDTRIVIVCNEGYSSSLAAATLQDLGLRQATDMIGGYQAWLTAHARGT